MSDLAAHPTLSVSGSEHEEESDPVGQCPPLILKGVPRSCIKQSIASPKPITMVAAAVRKLSERTP